MKTALLWNTYAKDLEWFAYSAKSYTKFARGFDRAVCFVPVQDVPAFQPVCDAHGIRLLSGTEWPGLGFNFHQFWQCCADLLCPDADIIFHLDSDTVFSQPVTPHNWLERGKVLVPFKRFADYEKEFGPKMWKSRVDAAIGGDVQLSTMITPPYVHYREVYVEARRAVVAAHPEGFEEYVQSCENSFPQGFAEFETLGAVAQGPEFHNEYVWHDVEKHGNPFRELVCEGWSHGGLDLVTDRFGDKTARQVFEDIGL